MIKKANEHVSYPIVNSLSTYTKSTGVDTLLPLYVYSSFQTINLIMNAKNTVISFR